MSVCPHCGASCEPNARRCPGCGLDPAAPPLGGDLLEAGVVCPQCDTYNEADRRTCLACGAQLANLGGLLQPLVGGSPAAEAAAPAESRTPAHGLSATGAGRLADSTDPGLPGPTAPVSRPRTAEMPAAVATPAAGSLCPYCKARLPLGGLVCLACGRRSSGVEPPQETARDLSQRLRLVRGYGREDSTFPIGPAGVTIGRAGATVSIPDDPFLAPMHLGLRLENGRLVAEDLGSLNGTFLRVRGQVEVKQGSEFVAGNQRFLLLGLGGPTTDVRMPVSPDTRPYGGPVPRALFVALRLHHADSAGRPMAGSVILRCGPVISVGQRGCDLNFPLDPALAPRHLELHLRPSGTLLVETSGGGVFLRLQAPTALQNGDEVLAGDEIFRVEIG